MGLSSLWKGKKKYYSYNNPVFDYGEGYQSNPSRLSFFDPMNPDWMGYGQYQGFNTMPTGLELLFQDRDILDTDYRVFDPLSQQWQQFEEQNQIRDYLTQNATGQWATDLAGMDDAALVEYLNQQNWMKEAYDYGDPYQRSLYYTPYNVALGGEVGNTPDMKATGKTASTNWASIHPNVDYSFWDNSTLTNLNTLPGVNSFTLGSTDDIKSWQDPSVSDWNKGFISETNPWSSGVAADYTTGSGSYRTGGLFGVLGPVLSFVPGLQWVGMAMSALNAAGHKNPLGVVTSFLPGIGQLGQLGTAASDMSQLMSQGLSASQAASIAGNAWNTSSGLLSGLSSLGALDTISGLGSAIDNTSNYLSTMNPYIRNSLISGTTSELSGGNFGTGALQGALGTGIGQYITPEVTKGLQSIGFNNDIANAFSRIASSYGTSAATNYLTSLDDNDNYSEAASRLVSNATPTTTTAMSTPSLTEGISSGYGLPAWMSPYNQPSTQQDTAKGSMTNNQIGSGFKPDKSTQYLVG